MMKNDVLTCKKCGANGEPVLPNQGFLNTWPASDKVEIKIMSVCGECDNFWMVKISDILEGEND